MQLQNNSVGTNGTSVTGRSTSNYGDSLTENDGPENNNSAFPYSTYTLANATLIGRGYGDWSRLGANPANDYNGGPFAGPNFKDNAGARTYNSLIMDNPHGAVLITDRVTDSTNNSFSGLGNSSINRYAGTRSGGGFDGAGRAADLSTSDITSPSGPDGIYNNTWFFRNGYADSTAVGVNGAYTNKTDFDGAYAAGLPNASSTNMFPNSHDRSGRGASANNSVNRANTAAVQAALTNANTRNVFNTNPGVKVSPYHRLSLDLRVTNPTAKDLSNSALPSYRGLNTNATFVGAIRDNVWMRGWTLGDKLGIYQGSAIEPVVTLTANGSQQPVISFGTEVGVKYVVQYSTDNIKYTTLTTVTADALSEAVTDTGRTVGGSAIFYRVIAL